MNTTSNVDNDAEAPPRAQAVESLTVGNTHDMPSPRSIYWSIGAPWGR